MSETTIRALKQAGVCDVDQLRQAIAAGGMWWKYIGLHGRYAAKAEEALSAWLNPGLKLPRK